MLQEQQAAQDIIVALLEQVQGLWGLARAWAKAGRFRTLLLGFVFVLSMLTQLGHLSHSIMPCPDTSPTLDISSLDISSLPVTIHLYIHLSIHLSGPDQISRDLEDSSQMPSQEAVGKPARPPAHASTRTHSFKYVICRLASRLWLLLAPLTIQFLLQEMLPSTSCCRF